MSRLAVAFSLASRCGAAAAVGVAVAVVMQQQQQQQVASKKEWGARFFFCCWLVADQTLSDWAGGLLLYFFGFGGESMHPRLINETELNRPNYLNFFISAQ